MMGVDAPVVSVVIPTRNRRQLLDEAIASVRAQQGVSWELIVVDDASTDDTRVFLGGLSGLRAIHLEAHGERSAARNRGLGEARGSYVMFLDDDDTLRPGALSSLASALGRHPGSVAAIGARQDWFVGENYRRREVHPLGEEARCLFDEVLFGWSAGSGQCLFRTSVLRSSGGYDSSLSACEDRDLLLRLARLGEFVLCPRTMMVYRIPPTQVRPPDIRRIREGVARRAIRALPAQARRRALLLRRCTALVDEAEDAVRSGAYLRASHRLGQAVWTAPGLMLSPLIGTWIARRLVGRAYHRWRGR